MKFTERVGYLTLIKAYDDACERRDWYWCDVLRPFIAQAVLAEQPNDIPYAERNAS